MFINASPTGSKKNRATYQMVVRCVFLIQLFFLEIMSFILYTQIALNALNIIQKQEDEIANILLKKQISHALFL